MNILTIVSCIMRSVIGHITYFYRKGGIAIPYSPLSNNITIAQGDSRGGFRISGKGAYRFKCVWG